MRFSIGVETVLLGIDAWLSTVLSAPRMGSPVQGLPACLSQRGSSSSTVPERLSAGVVRSFEPSSASLLRARSPGSIGAARHVVEGSSNVVERTRLTMVSPLRPKRCAERFLGPEKRHGGPRVTQVALAARQPDRSCEPVPVYPETRRRSENIHTGSVARPCFGTSSSATPERAQAGGPLLCRQTMPTTASVPERSGAGS